MTHAQLHSIIGAELPHLRRYALSLLRNTAEADDLVQATVERALSREAQWDPDKGLRPWLFRILHNLYVSNVRSRHRELKAQNLQWQDGGMAGSHESFAELSKLREMMDRLPDGHREIILLVAIQGFSYQEAASVTGVPVGTVRSRLSRAREHLRILIEQNSGSMPSTRGAE